MTRIPCASEENGPPKICPRPSYRSARSAARFECASCQLAKSSEASRLRRLAEKALSTRPVMVLGPPGVSQKRPTICSCLNQTLWSPSSWAANRIGKRCATRSRHWMTSASRTKRVCSPLIGRRTRRRTLRAVQPDRGLRVIIAGAGGAAHLAGVIAAHTWLPVLGVPIQSNLQGLDSLLSTAQMPGGIPVGTLAIGEAGAKNAALLAAADSGHSRTKRLRAQTAKHSAKSNPRACWPQLPSSASHPERSEGLTSKLGSRT